MTAVPVLLLVTAATALGSYDLWLWWRGDRKPALIAFHLLLGLGGAETLMVFLHSGGLDDGSPARSLALTAGACLGAAIFTGFVAALLGRGAPRAANSMLFAHVAAGVAGFLVVLAFVARL